MSQADFEKAKQRLAQAKQDIIWATNVLDDAAKNLSDYKLTPEEVVQLGYQFQRDLQDIRKNLEQKTDLEKDLKSSTIRYSFPPPNIGESREISERITGQIPPFDDPDEDNDRGISRSLPPNIGESREISPRITGEIPPFDDPDEDNDMGVSRSLF